MSLPKNLLISSSAYHHFSSEELGVVGAEYAKLVDTSLPILSSFILTPEWANYFYSSTILDQFYIALKKQDSKECQKLLRKTQINEVIIQYLETELAKHHSERLLHISISPLVTAHAPNHLVIPPSISNITQAVVELISKHLDEFFKKNVSPTHKFLPFFPAIFFQFQKKSEKSGQLWTTDPSAQHKQICLIKAWWGRFETLRSQPESADQWKVEKNSLEIIEEVRNTQEIEIESSHQGLIKQHVPPSRVNQRKLTEKEIIELALLAKKIQQNLFFPQYVTWTKRHKNIYIISSEAIGVTFTQPEKIEQLLPKPILVGTVMGNGSASAEVRIIITEKDWRKLRPTEIAVVKFFPKRNNELPKCAGMICESTLEPRQFEHWQIPIIANAKGATQKLINRQKVFLDSQEGIVYSDR